MPVGVPGSGLGLGLGGESGTAGSEVVRAGMLVTGVLITVTEPWGEIAGDGYAPVEGACLDDLGL